MIVPPWLLLPLVIGVGRAITRLVEDNDDEDDSAEPRQSSSKDGTNEATRRRRRLKSLQRNAVIKFLRQEKLGPIPPNATKLPPVTIHLVARQAISDRRADERKAMAPSRRVLEECSELRRRVSQALRSLRAER